MEYTTALGRCSICGQDKISVEGVNKCLSCDSNNNVGSGLVVRTEDPGADMIEKLLSKAGVTTVSGGKPPEPIKPALVKHVTNTPAPQAQYIPISSVSGIDQALAILRSLPMPKDLKQFKLINKAIKILESIGV